MEKLSKPWTYRKESLIVIALFGSTLALFSTHWFNALSIHPSTVAAERVLAGQIPYRDFWTLYAPGSFYLLAFFFRLFGTHLLVEHIAASTFCAAALCIYYRLILNLVGERRIALVSSAIVLACIYSTDYFLGLGPYPPTIFFILIGINFAVGYFKLNAKPKLAFAGISIGIAALIKHDVAVYAIAAISSGLVVHHLVNGTTLLFKIKSLVIDLTIFIGAAIVVAAPILAIFAYHAGADMWQDLMVFPSTVFRFARPESYPLLLPIGLKDVWLLKTLFNIFRYIQFNLPFLVFLFGIFAIGLSLGRQRLEYAAPGAIFVVAFLLHYSSAHVQINTNIISISIYAVALGAISYRLLVQDFFRDQNTLIELAGLAVATVWMISLVTQPIYQLQATNNQATVESELAKISEIRVEKNEHNDLLQVKNLVDKLAPNHQPVYVGLHRHDVTIIGTSKTYFILDRKNPTRHDQLHPGIADHAEFQQQIVRDLDRAKVNVIVLVHSFPDKVLDQTKALRSVNLPKTGARTLDEYIDRNFTPVRSIGRYEVLQRKTYTLSAN